ncbi:M15 family metallopeptidase [Micavibrio aeruginosavorus]|uniref:D-alanyl-D-alanine dipeptidase n=1 Tax=Micavibrio aeruginosavorus EPB TaxID=349215 RepID=M4VLP6_9BACT|nr:M15 family metallopeptidase [Micavibrio aeruginosavorus]AGH99041.1 D-alanyl-D-alanine dipeptidase [Micavibrio aeruginosavorus EPB]
MDQQHIPATDLIDMGAWAARDGLPLRVDLVYAQVDHPENIFGRALYRETARFWLHRDFAAIVADAAKIAYAQREWIFILKDGLRPVEAQALMQDTDIVKANPQWLVEPRLLSPPGMGGHPRAMAVDITPCDENGVLIDMGTVFDHLTTNPADNPAARSYTALPAPVLDNRAFLEDCMMMAAARHNKPMLPLPAEWWDFRFPKTYTDAYAPIHDRDLPDDMKMVAI